MADIEIARDLNAILEAFSAVKKEMAATKDELTSVNRGLKLDSGNVELLAQRSELLSRQLEENKQKSQLLGEAIAELNKIKAESGQLDATQEKQLVSLLKQQKDAEVQVIALTGATQRQVEVNKVAEESIKSFSESMTEFQANMRAVTQVMSGAKSAFDLFGGDPDSAMGKLITQGQQAARMMTGLASLGKLLQTQNVLTAGSFSNLALSAGAAAAAFTLADGLLSKLDGQTKVVAGAITTLIAAVSAGAVAWMTYHGTMTLGTAVPIILASVAAGVAGIKAMLPESAAQDAAAASVSGAAAISASATSASALTPSVPTYSNNYTTVTQPQAHIQTLSEKQVEAAVVNAITETGLGQTRYIGSAEINGRELVRLIFNDLLAVNAERGKPLKMG